MTVSEVSLTLYTTSWCGYCARLKSVLSAASIEFTEINIEKDSEAGDFVAATNHGNKTVPTVRFADGSTLTNPNPQEVKARLAEIAANNRRRPTIR
jgi:mycoredoxin